MSEFEIILKKLTALEELFTSQKPVLNIDECALLTGLSKSYIYKLTSSRCIPHYTSVGGSHLFFKRDEILTWMTAHRVPTTDEIEAQAINYVNKNRPKIK